MFTSVIAILIAANGVVREIEVTNTDMDENVTFISCAAIGLRETSAWAVREGWIARGYRIDRVKCVAGRRQKQEGI